jgi:hypothetical protein
MNHFKVGDLVDIVSHKKRMTGKIILLTRDAAAVETIEDGKPYISAKLLRNLTTPTKENKLKYTIQLLSIDPNILWEVE